MQAQDFDEITRHLETTATRRRVWRILGGVLAMGSGLAVSVHQTAAKKKGGGRKRCLKKCAPGFRMVRCQCRPTGARQEVCQPGTEFGKTIIPPTGVAVTTPVLRSGQRYRVRVSGRWTVDTPYFDPGIDAYAAFDPNNPETYNTTPSSGRIGVSLDGESPDAWGSYRVDHIYEREVVGRGAALSLYLTNSNFPITGGTVTAQVFCV